MEQETRKSKWELLTGALTFFVFFTFFYAFMEFWGIGWHSFMNVPVEKLFPALLFGAWTSLMFLLSRLLKGLLNRRKPNNGTK